MLDQASTWLGVWATILLLWVPCLRAAARHAVGSGEAPPPSRDYLLAVMVLMTFPALYTTLETVCMIFALVDGAEKAWVQRLMLTTDAVHIRATASMWSCLGILHMGLLLEAMRRTYHLRRRVRVHRILHAKRHLAVVLEDLPSFDEAAAEHHAAGAEDDNWLPPV